MAPSFLEGHPPPAEALGQLPSYWLKSLCPTPSLPGVHRGPWAQCSTGNNQGVKVLVWQTIICNSLAAPVPHVEILMQLWMSQLLWLLSAPGWVGMVQTLTCDTTPQSKHSFCLILHILVLSPSPRTCHV